MLGELSFLSIVERARTAFTPQDLTGFQKFLKEVFWPAILEANPALAKPSLKTRPYGSVTAGPNHNPAYEGVEFDALAWEGYSLQMQSQGLGPRDYVRDWSFLIKDEQLLHDFEEAIACLGMEHVPNPDDSACVAAGRSLWTKSGESGQYPLYLGKLSPVFEAAGKVRIVAICDAWTQRICVPIHTWMEGVLRTLPADSTFDQDGSLQSFVKKGLQYVASYDLKSATDRIPLILYRMVFEASPLGRERTELWLKILTDRSFFISRRIQSSGPDKGFVFPEADLETHLESLSSTVPEPHLFSKQNPFIRYGAGQPMGALSSWPSMAIVHHAVLLYCAWCTKHVVDKLDLLAFDMYRLLGDDITIGVRAVAEAYAAFMGRAGVVIGLAKSYVSEFGLANFANQTYLGNGENISPISLRAELGVETLTDRFLLAVKMLQRGWVGKKIYDMPALLRLTATPALWLEWRANLSRKERPRADILLVALNWLYPNPEIFKVLGVPNLSLHPLFRGLTMSKWYQGLLAFARSGRSLNLPREVDVACIDAFLRSFSGPLNVALVNTKDALAGVVRPLADVSKGLWSSGKWGVIGNPNADSIRIGDFTVISDGSEDPATLEFRRKVLSDSGHATRMFSNLHWLRTPLATWRAKGVLKPWSESTLNPRLSSLEHFLSRSSVTWWQATNFTRKRLWFLEILAKSEGQLRSARLALSQLRGALFWHLAADIKAEWNPIMMLQGFDPIAQYYHLLIDRAKVREPGLRLVRTSPWLMNYSGGLWPVKLMDRLVLLRLPEGLPLDQCKMPPQIDWDVNSPELVWDPFEGKLLDTEKDPVPWDAYKTTINYDGVWEVIHHLVSAVGQAPDFYRFDPISHMINVKKNPLLSRTNFLNNLQRTLAGVIPGVVSLVESLGFILPKGQLMVLDSNPAKVKGPRHTPSLSDRKSGVPDDMEKVTYLHHAVRVAVEREGSTRAINKLSTTPPRRGLHV
jgi:hypothetical protein